MCLTYKIKKQIDDIVKCFISRLQDFDNLVSHVKDDFIRNQDFYNLIHSAKFRTKDPEHLRWKLERIAMKNKANNKLFKITKENVFNQVNDLAGVRFLHLYTEQMEQIHPMIIEILGHYKYKQVYKPVAYIWDIETQRVFKNLGIRTVQRESMYTSVHYVIQSNYSKDRCEIQVRTLMEEVWGEVSHKINYPQETLSEACQEQLKVLARITSGCKRLVDSIIVSHREYETFLKNTNRAKRR